jgi:threonine dehydrogenase-like Zn-dependent dehydrogenase
VAVGEGDRLARWVDDILPLALDQDDLLGTADLVTHVLPLEEGPAAYGRFQRKNDGMVKVVLRP